MEKDIHISLDNLKRFKENADKYYYNADNPPPESGGYFDGLFEIPISLQSYTTGQLSTEELKYINDNINIISKGAFFNLNNGMTSAVVTGYTGTQLFSNIGDTAISVDLVGGVLFGFQFPVPVDNPNKIPQTSEDGRSWNYIDIHKAETVKLSFTALANNELTVEQCNKLADLLDNHKVFYIETELSGTDVGDANVYLFPYYYLISSTGIYAVAVFDVALTFTRSGPVAENYSTTSFLGKIKKL